MSKASGRTVAVCGATGLQGGGTVAALLQLGGFKIRALTRDPNSKAAQTLAQQGVEVVKADFDDPESLREVFEGADAVFGVTDFWKACQCDPRREIQQGKNLVDAAKAAGVKHFVWSTLEDTRPASKGILQPVTGDMTVPHFDGKADIDAYLREQVPSKWTSLLTSMYYENMLPGHFLCPQKQEDGSYALVAPVKSSKMAWCATPDIGNVAAAVIAGGAEKFAGKTVPVVCEHASLADMASKMSKATGKKVVAVTPSTDDFVGQLKGSGMPEEVAKDMANMFVYYDAGKALEMRKLEDTKAVFPRAQDADAWCAAHKQALMDAMG